MSERDDLKAWLRALRGPMTQVELAEKLGVSSRVVMNAENPRMGFPNGFTMIRLLRELGAASAAPVVREPTVADRLAILEDQVALLATKEDLVAALEALRESLASAATPGTRQKTARRAG